MQQIGFIGKGAMAEALCRHLAAKSGLRVLAKLDMGGDHALQSRLAGEGVARVDSMQSLFSGSEVVFLALPSGERLRDLALQPRGMMSVVRRGQIVADLGATSVDITRELAVAFAEMGAVFVDSPVAGGREAAEAAQLLALAGGDAAAVEKIRPLLATFATDIVHCGNSGCGQLAKSLNDMVGFEALVALAEAKAIAERSGMDPRKLFEALSRSAALRVPGMKALLLGAFPEGDFSVEHARRDLAQALRLAEQAGVDARGARLAEDWYAEAVQAGLGARHHAVIGKLIGG